MTIQQLLNLATQKLSQSKSTSPLLDAEVLLSHLLDQPKEYLFTHADQILSPKLEREFKIRLNRRIKGWPVAYINNKKEFFGLSLFVNKNVLIPRPETEGLVELVLDKAKSQKNIKILDIGTGSGAIIISLAKILGISGNKFFASDISKKALAVAQKNAKQNS
ncbi:MAG TPA: HemK/PrmC family methyltransferase, partial [Methylomirabilota bacterium]|nr:HemK/PrmC family methyltransferase [Methylomirabilota bacterium]